MKQLKWMMPLLVVLGLSATSCKKHIFNSIKGKGGTVTEQRQVSGFNKIALSIDANVIYTQDSIYYVELSGQQNVLEVLTTEVSAGELKIDFSKWVRKHSNITIIIHSPDIRGLNISGSGNIEVNGAVSSVDMDMHISGSGNIVLPSLTTDELEASISGSGNIYINGGAVDNQEVTISGSGDIKCENLMANNSAAKISGSGSITVWVIEQLDATISGSGDIKYKGTPIVNTHISGSGSVIHI